VRRWRPRPVRRSARAAARATNALFETGSVAFEPIQFLIVTDVSYLIISFLLSDFVLDE